MTQDASTESQETIDHRSDFVAELPEAVVTPAVIQKQADIAPPLEIRDDAHAEAVEQAVEAALETTPPEPQPRAQPQARSQAQPQWQSQPQPQPEARPEPQPQPALKLEWPSDLVQIETDPTKARAAAEAAEIAVYETQTLA